MTKNKLLVLIAICVVLLLVAFFVFRGDPEARQVASGNKKVLSEINGEQISRIELYKNEEKIVLENQEGAWVLPEKGGYKANLGKIRSLLLKLLELTSSQTIPSTPEGVENLGLNEDGVKLGYAKVLLLDDQNQELGGLHVGKLREAKGATAPGMPAVLSGGGQYVRPMESENIYIVSTPLVISTANDEWLENSILNVLESKVHRVEQYDISTADDKPEFVLARAGSVFDYKKGVFNLFPPPEQGKEQQKTIISQLGAGLENLKFSDVHPIDPQNEITEKLVYDRETLFYLTSGLFYRVRTALGENDTVFATFEVAYDIELVSELKALETEALEAMEAVAEEEAEQTETEESVPEKVKAEKKKLEFSTEEESVKLHEKYSKWIYQFEGFQGSKFRRKRSELLRDKEQAS